MKLVLREVRLEDGKNIVHWRNDIKVISHCLDKTLITEESNVQYFNKRILTGEVKQFIVERSDDEWGGVFGYPIGTIYLKKIDRYNHQCELGMYPGNDIEWNGESQKIAVKLLLQKAFEEYGIHKVYSYVFADCQDEIDLLLKCGFEQERKIVAEICDQDGCRDILQLSICV